MHALLSCFHLFSSSTRFLATTKKWFCATDCVSWISIMPSFYYFILLWHCDQTIRFPRQFYLWMMLPVNQRWIEEVRNQVKQNFISHSRVNRNIVLFCYYFVQSIGMYFESSSSLYDIVASYLFFLKSCLENKMWFVSEVSLICFLRLVCALGKCTIFNFIPITFFCLSEICWIQ